MNPKIEHQKYFICSPPRCGSHFLNKAMYFNPFVVGSRDESKVFQDIVGTIKHSKRPWNRWLFLLQYKYKEFRGLESWGVSKDFFKEIISREIKSSKNKDEKLNSIVRAIFNNYYELNATERSKALVEKTPSHTHYAKYILDNFDDSNLILLIRNPLDVVKSLKKLALKNEFWVPNNLDSQIDIWVGGANKIIDILNQKKYANRIILVQYEDLISNFDSEIKRLFSFMKCDLSSNDFEDFKENISVNLNRKEFELSEEESKIISEKSQKQRNFFNY